MYPLRPPPPRPTTISSRSSWHASEVLSQQILPTIDEEDQHQEDDDDMSIISISKSIIKRSRRKIKSKMDRTGQLHMFYLAVLSAIIVVSYDFVLKGSNYHISDIDERTSAEQRRMLDEIRAMYTFAEPAKSQLEERRRLEVEDQLEKRILEMLKDRWPRCSQEKMTGLQCKTYIDDEIHNGLHKDGRELFTGQDKLIRVILRRKRRKTDPNYNVVSIVMNDANIVEGVDGSGEVQVPFTWEGSGEVATVEQQTSIPPYTAVETDAGAPTADPEIIGPTADPNSTAYEPMIFYEEAVVVEGATVEAAFLGTDTAPIAGGTIIDPATSPDITSTPEGEATFDAQISEALYTAEVPTGAEATRDVPPLDCDGLNGYNCCLLLKATVKDSDVNGNAIQCHLTYSATTNKAKVKLNMRGKKVFVNENHNGRVRKTPKVVGGWPGGQGDGLESWVEAGGNPDTVYSFVPTATPPA